MDVRVHGEETTYPLKLSLLIILMRPRNAPLESSKPRT